MKIGMVIVLAILVTFCAELPAQTSTPVDLTDHHTIGISGGAKTNSRTVVATDLSGVSLETGFIGLFQYGYWFDPQWQLNVALGIFGAKTDTDYLGTKINATMPVLFGVSYAPLALAMGKAGRPFVGIAPGVYVQTATMTSTVPPFATETSSETVLGVRFIAGADLFPAQWLRITPSLSYHLMGEFSKVGSYSGAEFSVGLGVVF